MNLLRSIVRGSLFVALNLAVAAALAAPRNPALPDATPEAAPRIQGSVDEAARVVLPGQRASADSGCGWASRKIPGQAGSIRAEPIRNGPGRGRRLIARRPDAAPAPALPGAGGGAQGFHSGRAHAGQSLVSPVAQAGGVWPHLRAGRLGCGRGLRLAGVARPHHQPGARRAAGHRILRYRGPGQRGFSDRRFTAIRSTARRTWPTQPIPRFRPRSHRSSPALRR